MENPSRRTTPGGDDDRGRRLEVEQPGLEVYHPSPPLREQGTALPEVYWANDDGDFNASKYTFYREGSPDPEKAAAAGGGYAAGGPAAVDLYEAARAARAARGEFVEEPSPPPKAVADDDEQAGRVCGLRKVVFWLLLLAGLLVAVALAVGLGVGLKKDYARVGPPVVPGTASTGTPSATGTDTIVPTPSPSATGGPSATTTRSSSPSATPSIPPISECPASNGTVHTVPGTTKRFLRICGIDYSGVSEAVDLTHEPTANMTACMARCAATLACTGCGWGFIEGDVERQHRCWLKTSLLRPHEAREDWEFAVLQ